MIIDRANTDDISEVAKLHVRAFPGFFLTSLGLPFLEELYAGFLSHKTGIFVVAKDEGRIVGFAAGTSASEVFFPDLRRRRRLAFVLKAIPSILRNPLPVCRKLLYAVRYRGEAPAEKTSGALLSSIGVASMHQGSGLAAALVSAFEEKASAHGASFVYLTTDVEQNDRVNAFYRKNGYLPVCHFYQDGRREMYRYEKQLLS